MNTRGIGESERFMMKILKDANSSCWLWAASKTNTGYGRFRRDGRSGKTVLAHRFSYELAFGAIPAGSVIDHKCYEKSCVNPAHLQAVTSKQNNENLPGATKYSRSGIRGVHWHKGSSKWAVSVRHNGKLHYGGMFLDVDDAERAAIKLRNTLHTNNLADRIISDPTARDAVRNLEATA